MASAGRATFAKAALPLAALAVLSTLFLFSRSIEMSGSRLLDDDERASLIGQDMIGEPQLSMVLADGAALTVEAMRARSTDPGRQVIDLEEVNARLRTVDGMLVTLAGKEATLDFDGSDFTLAGTAEIGTGAGHLLAGERFTGRLDRLELRSSEPVTMTGPEGRLEAGAMSLTLSEVVSGDEVLVFSGGVKLIYAPLESDR